MSQYDIRKYFKKRNNKPAGSVELSKALGITKCAICRNLGRMVKELEQIRTTRIVNLDLNDGKKREKLIQHILYRLKEL